MIRAACMVLAAAAVSSCALLERMNVPPPSVATCNSAVCQLDVAVEGCVASPSSSAITVTKRNTQIHWNLTTPGYAFVAINSGSITDNRNPVFIKGDPKNQFEQLQRPNDRKVILKDRNDGPVGSSEAFDYGIRVRGPAGDCPVKDPTIINAPQG